MIKKYRAKSHVSLSVLLKSGKSVHVTFSPLTGGGSVFYTGDAELQQALERHLKYGRLFKLEVKKEPPTLVKQLRYTSAAPEPSAEVSEKPAKKKAEPLKYVVACNDDAKEYLADKFGVSRSKMRNRTQIEEVAKANNVELVWK